MKPEYIVHLDLYELQNAAQIALLRNLETIKYGENWGFGYKKDYYTKLKDSVVGCAGEFAVAKFLKIKTPIHVNHGANADIVFKGIQIQVKTQTENKYQPKYYIRNNALEHELFCFVIDRTPQFEIKGFIFAKDIINDKSRLTDFGITSRPPVYLIQEEELKPLNQIV